MKKFFYNDCSAPYSLDGRKYHNLFDNFLSNQRTMRWRLIIITYLIIPLFYIFEFIWVYSLKKIIEKYAFNTHFNFSFKAFFSSFYCLINSELFCIRCYDTVNKSRIKMSMSTVNYHSFALIRMKQKATINK